MDATLDFYAENAQRRFPLDQDCLPAAADGFVWPDNALLDARGCCRLDPAGSPTFYLLAFVGSACAGAAPFVPAAGASSLFFGRNPTAGTFDFRIDVPVAFNTPAAFPATLRAAVPDPWYAAAGALLGGLEVTVGAGVLALDATQLHTFGAAAPLEPSCVANLFRNQVDALLGIPAAAPLFASGPAAELRGGYNVDVRAAKGRVGVTTRLGGGELGAYAGETAGMGCGAVLRTLNGVGPDGSDRFFLKAGVGVRVENLPAQHTINVLLATDAFGTTACNPDQVS